MAASNLSSGDRLQAYELMFLLNSSFHRIVVRLSELDRIGIFNPQRLIELRGLTQELQSEVNHHLLGTLNTVEDRDWYEFGLVRIARDERLRESVVKSSRQ